MAIVKMKKFTLLAFESQRAELLEKLQAFAEVEFINLQDNDFLESNEDFKDLSKEGLDSEYAECEEKLSKAKFALNFLKEYVPQKSGLQALKEGKVELTLKEFELLLNLVKNKNRALSREYLLEKIWGYEYMGETRTVDTHIQKLRRKLNLADNIKTVYKIGYRLEE